MTDDRQWYRHNLRCRTCAHRFHVDRLTADPNKVKPGCPKCGGKTKQSFMADVGMDIAAGKAPAQVGASVTNNAYDRAMEITMQTQGMTDIQDHSRPGSVYRAGENTAPKVPSHLQSQVDNFWGGQKRQARTARVDMTPLFGERAQNAGLPPAQFKAQSGQMIEPILRHKPVGSSAVPDHTVIAEG